MKYVSFVVLMMALACTTKKQGQDTTQTNSTQIVAAAIPADSLSLDLLALQAKEAFGPVETIKVADDPVFHKAKTYRAVLLRSVLEKYIGLKNRDLTKTQIVFECEDGYNPSVELSKVLERTAYLAVADADAPKGQNWTEVRKDGQTKKIAPFYVVYTDVAASEHGYKWPYNLVRIRLVPIDAELKVLFPSKDELAVKGYDLFRQNCLTCHALNGVGGVMGPELNSPKSVTEYWHKDHLKAFIKDPASYRKGVKMPKLSYLKDQEIDDIIYYLSYMASNK